MFEYIESTKRHHGLRGNELENRQVLYRSYRQRATRDLFVLMSSRGLRIVCGTRLLHVIRAVVDVAHLTQFSGHKGFLRILHSLSRDKVRLCLARVCGAG